jgi:hypothetical protein
VQEYLRLKFEYPQISPLLVEAKAKKIQLTLPEVSNIDRELLSRSSGSDQQHRWSQNAHRTRMRYDIEDLSKSIVNDEINSRITIGIEMKAATKPTFSGEVANHIETRLSVFPGPGINAHIISRINLSSRAS